MIEKGAKVELQITTLSKPVTGHVAAVVLPANASDEEDELMAYD